jgi:hypothetical protein
MRKKRDRIVYRRDDGNWVNKRIDAVRAGGIHDTLAEADQSAHRMLKNDGGGELTIKGRDGRIRSKDTIAPGNDPCPPKDREH